MTLTIELSTPLMGSYKQPIGLFINNEWVEGVDKKKFEVINPSTEEVICSVCEGNEKDVDIAVVAARKAFEGPWRTEIPPSERARMLFHLADLTKQNFKLLAEVETLESGKSITTARAGMENVISTLRYYAGWADKIEGKTKDLLPNYFHYTRHEPIGVCGQIVPWNFPLSLVSWKIGPALATGNTVVIKSAEQTPLSVLIFANLVIEAGFPPGVFNLISGFGKTAGAAIASHMDIDKVAFTGSTVVGRSILQAAAASNLKKVTLELGGKSPHIIFDDADVDEAVKSANSGIYFNNGQCCSAGSRIFVQEGIYDKFVDTFRRSAEAVKVGNPFYNDTFQGPQVSKQQFDRIMDYIKSGRDDGATVVTGGERHGNRGYFIKPTVFADVRPDMKIMREEIFGPVCAIAKFKDEAEAIRVGNDTTYGLAAGIHTKDLGRAVRVSNALRAGTVWVNSYGSINAGMPFGGFKESGIGKELGEEGLANYIQVKAVSMKLN